MFLDKESGLFARILGISVIKRHPVPPLTPTAVLAHALIFHFWPYASISGAESSLAIFHFQGCAMLCIATSAVVCSSCQENVSMFHGPGCLSGPQRQLT